MPGACRPGESERASEREREREREREVQLTKQHVDQIEHLHTDMDNLSEEVKGIKTFTSEAAQAARRAELETLREAVGKVIDVHIHIHTTHTHTHTARCWRRCGRLWAR